MPAPDDINADESIAYLEKLIADGFPIFPVGDPKRTMLMNPDFLTSIILQVKKDAGLALLGIVTWTPVHTLAVMILNSTAGAMRNGIAATNEPDASE